MACQLCNSANIDSRNYQPGAERVTVENLAASQAPFKLIGKTAIVTGGGRGIGRAIIMSLASAGASVLAADLDYDALEETRNLAGYPDLLAIAWKDLPTKPISLI